YFAGIIWKLLATALAVFIGGWLMTGLLTIAALDQPQWFSPVFCPVGTRAATGLVSGLPGEVRPSLICVDQAGSIVMTLTDAERQALERQYFYAPSNILLAILGVAHLVFSSIPKVTNEESSP